MIRLIRSRTTGTGRSKTAFLSCVLFAILPLAYHQEAWGVPDATLAKVKRIYEKGDYREVIKLCQQALHVDPQDAQLHYYLANSLMLTGSIEEAKAEYSETISHSKDNQLTEYCSKALASLNGKSPAQDKQPRSQPIPRKQPQYDDNDLPVIPEPDWRNLSGEDRAHVTVEGQGPTADRAYKDVLWALSHLPRALKDAYWSANVQIVIVVNIGDLSKAKGWTNTPPGFQDWGQLHGITDHNIVSVAQTAGVPNRYIVKKPGRVSFHELGHAFDYNVGRHPHHPDMQAVYEQDRAEHKPGTKYHNETPTELFADLCADINTQAGGVLDPDSSEKLAAQKAAYPRCWEFVRELLSAYNVSVPK